MGQFKRQLVIWGAIATTTAVLPGLALAENASPDFGHHGRGHDRANTKLAVAGRAASKAQQEAYGIEIRGRSGDQPTDAGGMVRFAHRNAQGAGEGLVGQITCLSKDSAGVVTATGTIKRGGTRAAKGDKGKSLKPGSETATAASDDDGTALLDELAPWDDSDTADLAAADEASTDSADVVAADPAPPSVPGAPAAPNMPAPPNQDPNKKPDHGRRGGGELAGKDFAFSLDVAGKPQHFSQPKIADKGTLAACSGGGTPVEVTRGGFRTRDASSADNGNRHGDGDRRHDGRGRRGDHRHGWWRR
jgi:hypothetical protein